MLTQRKCTRTKYCLSHWSTPAQTHTQPLPRPDDCRIRNKCRLFIPLSCPSRCRTVQRLRVQAWRQEQQILATCAAREAERVMSRWWKAEAEKLWAMQSQRRRSHEELATRQEAELAAREKHRADVREIIGNPNSATAVVLARSLAQCFWNAVTYSPSRQGRSL